MKTLKELQDYLSTTDNVWLKNKLELIELEFQIELVKAQRGLIKELMTNGA